MDLAVLYLRFRNTFCARRSGLESSLVLGLGTVKTEGMTATEIAIAASTIATTRSGGTASIHRPPTPGTRTARACHGSHLQGTHRVPAGSIGIKSNGKEKRTSMPSVHVCLRILKKRALNFSRKEYGSRISTLFRLEQSRSIPSGPWVTLGALVGLRTAFARHNRTPPCDMGTRGSGGSQACKDCFLCVQMF